MTDETADLAMAAGKEAEYHAEKRGLEHFEVIVFARVEGQARIAVACDEKRDPVDQLLALLTYAKQHADLHGLPFSFNQESAA